MSVCLCSMSDYLNQKKSAKLTPNFDSKIPLKKTYFKIHSQIPLKKKHSTPCLYSTPGFSRSVYSPDRAWSPDLTGSDRIGPEIGHYAAFFKLFFLLLCLLSMYMIMIIIMDHRVGLLGRSDDWYKKRPYCFASSWTEAHRIGPKIELIAYFFYHFCLIIYVKYV